MASHVAAKRTRVQRGKTRAGCSRCKARHLKCDEALPSCVNCRRAGIACPGYQCKLRWSVKHERFHNTQRAVDDCQEATSGTRPSKRRSKDTLPVSRQAATPFPWPTEDEFVAPFSEYIAVDEEPLQPFVGSAPKCIVHDLFFTAPETARDESVISRNPLHLPTELIEYWFSHVCQMWSTFDSDVNYNRQVATINCTTSEVVFVTLQSMSAAYLAEWIPEIKHLVPSLVLDASAAIASRTSSALQSSKRKPEQVTIDLVFAVFALGTSIHWSDPSNDSGTLLKTAQKLLAAWELQPADSNLLHIEYFRQALIYWEMLYCVASSGRSYRNAKLHQRRVKYAKRVARPTQLKSYERPEDLNIRCLSAETAALGGTRPNSWCGMSSDVVDILSQVLELCRDAHERQNLETLLSSPYNTDAECDISPCSPDAARTLDFGL